jgi:hypothetical protein
VPPNLRQPLRGKRAWIGLLSKSRAVTLPVNLKDVNSVDISQPSAAVGANSIAWVFSSVTNIPLLSPQPT